MKEIATYVVGVLVVYPVSKGKVDGLFVCYTALGGECGSIVVLEFLVVIAIGARECGFVCKVDLHSENGGVCFVAADGGFSEKVQPFEKVRCIEGKYAVAFSFKVIFLVLSVLMAQTVFEVI